MDNHEIFYIGKGRPITFSLGKYKDAVDKAVKGLDAEGFAEKFFAKDYRLWKSDPTAIGIVKNSLGWIDVATEMTSKADEILAFASEVQSAGMTDVVLLGMGGSSLAPEVMRLTFREKAGWPRLHVLDSTEPARIKALTDSIKPSSTLFIVSSKSGSTIEPLCFFSHFHSLVKEAKGPATGENFIAITDPGSPLEAFAAKSGFRRVFRNQPDIGGRYSALSYFGLVPAALTGVDIKKLLQEAVSMYADSTRIKTVAETAALYLGATLGTLATLGRDKVTFFLSEEIESFGVWLEQLIAESTGKEDVGIVPIADEPLGDIESYGPDRVFVHIGAGFLDEHYMEAIHYLEKAGHPIISMRINESYGLGGEFLRWEMATAVAGKVLDINPFDQPDVESAKIHTKRLLESASDKDKRLKPGAIFKGADFRVYLDNDTIEKFKATPVTDEAEEALTAFFGLVKETDYVALLAYLDPADTRIHGALSGLRQIIRDALGTATQLGYGPRYLHSTGQLHKGGPNSGVYLIFFHNKPGADNIAIPGKGYTFLELESAQALGDLGALQDRRRRVALFNLNTPFDEALKKAYASINKALLPHRKISAPPQDETGAAGNAPKAAIPSDERPF